MAELRVALTFDAEHPDRSWCPPGGADRILDILAKAHISSTFFVQGRWAEAYPRTAQRIASDGHVVGHHSHYHARMPLLLGGGLEEDVADGERVIREVVGVDPHPWFRCPFGAGHDDPRVLERLAALGYRNVFWNVQAEDWEPWRTGSDIAQDIIEGVRSHGDGAVVLLHTWPGGTSEGLPELVDGLRELGSEFVTIERLETLP